MGDRIENLVIFSTLNQITNYIAIKTLKPKNIYNITFDKSLAKNFKYGINPEEWDENLKKVLKKQDIKPLLYIKESTYIDLKKFEDMLIENIDKNIDEKTPIYWHITGGQRIFPTAIYNIVKKRNRDIMFYLEGNTEKIITMGTDEYAFKSRMKNGKENNNEYGLDDLDFETAFQLMEYDTKCLNSTLRLKEKGEICLDIDKKERDFYNTLYQWIVKPENKNLNLEVGSKKGTFIELLIASNSTKGFDNQKRKEFLKNLFDKVTGNCKNIDDYAIEKSNEMNKGFPAGYIFEKIVGYKILDVVEKNPKILDMRMSLKLYNNESKHSVDELDIVLLTNTGKILNFECKTGSLKGDNAKSHNFTTYSISGVFGTPIFMTPMLELGEDSKIRMNWSRL